ncbi:MAG: phosphoribosylformylglycinamidine synthase subunit PurL [Clostridia bacterium]|nr:phosphoribosylformylglycinamidine synthase subunit PurL [Clostridia bacterium]
MGLRENEYELIKEILGREPNYLELGMFAVMWSEHCSYKNSKNALKLFPTKGKRVICGPGENAGAVDIGNGKAVAFKVESHNHPSAIDPFRGAATGVGGIVRDILCMGARPIAMLNSLRFGSLDNSRGKYLFNGAVSGIAWYGNCLGVPTVGGEVYFNKNYEGNPLVNAMCIGILNHDDLARGRAEGVGNPVMLVGARTGRDGIHGATFASEELSSESEGEGPTVVGGDPFVEKLLLEACLEVNRAGYLVGMQDLGAAGITGATSETASRAGLGMEIDIKKVPLREEGMTPYEIMLSESQERMLIIPKKGKEGEVERIFKKWDLEAVVIGYVTDDGILRVKNGDKVEAEIPARALTEMCPVYNPEKKEPAYLKETRSFDWRKLPVPENMNKVLLELLSHPSIASKEWIYRQYDHMVGTNTVVRPGSDAAVLRIKGTKTAIAATMDGNGKYCYLDPRTGGAIVVAEAARNLVCAGARPIALTDCLNFGSPEKPEIYWQFEQVIRGMSEAAEALGTPVISGNVSLYNESDKGAIYPTPIVGMVGLIEDTNHIRSQGFQNDGDLIFLLGRTEPELGASMYLEVVHGLETGKVPALDLKKEKAVQELCLEGIGAGLIKSAHDCSDGGLAVAIAESCISGNIGAEINLVKGNLELPELLFGETQSRIIVTVDRNKGEEMRALTEKFGVPVSLIGQVGGEELKIKVNGISGEVINLSISKLEEAWRGAIKCMMD